MLVGIWVAKSKAPISLTCVLNIKDAGEVAEGMRERLCCSLAICSVARVELVGVRDFYHGVLASRGTQMTAELLEEEELDYLKLLFWKCLMFIGSTTIELHHQPLILSWIHVLVKHRNCIMTICDLSRL